MTNWMWPVFWNSKHQWLAVDDLISQHCTHRTSWYLTISIYFHPRRLHSTTTAFALTCQQISNQIFCQGINLTGRSGPLSHSVAPIGRNVLELPEPLTVIMMQSLVELKAFKSFKSVPPPNSGQRSQKIKTNLVVPPRIKVPPGKLWPGQSQVLFNVMWLTIQKPVA